MIFKIATMKDTDILPNRFSLAVIEECKQLANIFEHNYNYISMNCGLRQ